MSAHIGSNTRPVNGMLAEGSAPPTPPPTTARRRAPWLIALGGGLVALLAIFGRPLTAGTREAVIVDVPAAATRIQLNLQATPPSARFVLDGQALETNPYQGERTADAFAHTLEVSAEGHQRRSIEVRLERDLDLDVRLAEEAPPRPIEAGIAAQPTVASQLSPVQPTSPRPAAPQPRDEQPRDQQPREPRSAPARRAPETVRAANMPAPPRAQQQSADDLYPDEPLPAPKPAPLEGY